MFDKELYWERRKKGLPGQENIVSKNLLPETPGSHTKQIGTKLMRVNREVYRKRLIDRTFTKTNYRYGKKIHD